MEENIGPRFSIESLITATQLDSSVILIPDSETRLQVPGFDQFIKQPHKEPSTLEFESFINSCNDIYSHDIHIKSNNISAHSISDPKDWTFELLMREQPRRARACGFGEKDRRSIDPPPVAQLIVKDSRGVISPDDYMEKLFFIAHVSLISAESNDDQTLIIDMQGQPTNILLGSLVSSAYYLKDLDGNKGLFFIFPDLSIRIEGSYRLKITCVNVSEKARETLDLESDVSATVFSNTLRSYTPKKFPGMLESSPLIKSFAKQGIKVTVRSKRDSVQENDDATV